MTEATVTRKTKETDIVLTVRPGAGESAIDTGVGFFDHMLTAFAFHGGFSLAVKVTGDLHVDAHHTVEDTGLALGKALREALGDCAGIERFGESHVPMDEALGFAALDISSRPFLCFDAPLSGTHGGFDASLTKEFFRALTVQAGFTLHLEAKGENAHHMTEALFKAAGRAFKMASRVTGTGVPSTKGAL
ncbi:MAG: imidazoleglycerol-phosphate dehydratase HisB [Oscillospiraceae bacterium]|jgi:imidazoleglycerol-phosphate dehydratase|nr:imidazoleglycerol-phosphate dehydratase HisB [Oscillospiraceae bacterium]